MKRTALVSLALMLAASTANAQLTMQMSNGWNFTFSGNVNAFYVYTQDKCSNQGNLLGSDGTTSSSCGVVGLPQTEGLVPVGPQEDGVSRIRTGLLPAFAVFEAKGKEGNTDLGVHFGFAPQIQNSDRAHDQFGAQIDMRQVFLTAGGGWGQILAGRELSLWQRQNILTDMTIFGVGVSGDPANGGGTTLGRIGTGYIYPNFNAQFTYSTPAGKPAQLSIGIFDPAAWASNNGVAFDVTKAPRLEGEFTWTTHYGGSAASSTDDAIAAGDKKFMFWVNFMVQQAKTAPGAGQVSITSDGVGGGIQVDLARGLELVGSGYYGQGVGTTLMFSGLSVDANNNKRNSTGYIGQLQWQPGGTSKWKIGASYGNSRVSLTDTDKNAIGSGNLSNDNAVSNSSFVGALTYMWTKSLRWVFEYTYVTSESFDGSKATANQGATGLMLFF